METVYASYGMTNVSNGMRWGKVWSGSVVHGVIMEVSKEPSPAPFNINLSMSMSVIVKWQERNVWCLSNRLRGKHDKAVIEYKQAGRVR